MSGQAGKLANIKTKLTAAERWWNEIENRRSYWKRLKTPESVKLRIDPFKFHMLGFITIILAIASCGGPEAAEQDVAKKSEPLRIALVGYYETNGSFPLNLELLGGVYSNLSGGGNRWNEWKYFSRTDSYNHTIFGATQDGRVDPYV
jgi:hypothetical protein